MAKIILVDDEAASGTNTESVLQDEGHSVEWVREDRLGPCQDALREILNSYHVDFLVLDMQLGKEMYAGIWLYNNLVAWGMRPKWNHTILYSKHAADNILAATYRTSPFPIKVFVHTAQIPLENVIQSMKKKRQPLVDRIDELLRSGPPAHCTQCGHCSES